LRRREIVPRLAGMKPGGTFTVRGHAVEVGWTLGDGSRLRLAANLGRTESPVVPLPAGEPIHATAPLAAGASGALPPWSVFVTREASGG
jgi:maltooligosyltrehalose trehalohydrolase